MSTHELLAKVEAEEAAARAAWLAAEPGIGKDDLEKVWKACKEELAQLRQSLAAGTSTGTSAGTEELRVSKITLLIPTGSADQPFNVRSFRNATMTGLRGTLENLNASTVLPVPDLSTAVTADTTEVPMLSDIQLHDQGTYLVVLVRLPLEMQLAELQGWQRSMVALHEAGAAERAAKYLTDHGHTGVKLLCRKRFKDPAGGISMELDGVAVADDAAAIVEAKTTLTYEAAEQLHKKLQLIRSGAYTWDGLQSLKDKKLIGLLAGKTITQDTKNYTALKKMCKQRHFEWFLPDGSDNAVGSSCYPSPVRVRAPRSKSAVQASSCGQPTLRHVRHMFVQKVPVAQACVSSRRLL